MILIFLFATAYGNFVDTTISPGMITIHFPNYGSVLEVGKTYNILWTYPSTATFSNYVIIHLLSSTGNHVIIDKNAPDTGNYLWKVPPNIITGHYVLLIKPRLETLGDGVGLGEQGSSATFSIVMPSVF